MGTSWADPKVVLEFIAVGVTALNVIGAWMLRDHDTKRDVVALKAELAGIHHAIDRMNAEWSTKWTRLSEHLVNSDLKIREIETELRLARGYRVERHDDLAGS